MPVLKEFMVERMKLLSFSSSTLVFSAAKLAFSSATDLASNCSLSVLTLSAFASISTRLDREAMVLFCLLMTSWRRLFESSATRGGGQDFLAEFVGQSSNSTYRVLDCARVRFSMHTKLPRANHCCDSSISRFIDGL